MESGQAAALGRVKYTLELNQVEKQEEKLELELDQEEQEEAWK